MSDHPILFSGEMVRAILDGRKTQTRRIVADKFLACIDPELDDERVSLIAGCPYGQPGDRLWVRETFTDAFIENDSGSKWAAYRADGAMIDHATGEHSALVVDMHWRPSIFMPRWASRITLEVVSVRVERLQEISNADAKAEGFKDALLYPEKLDALYYFKQLWHAINGKRAPWASNPWVWVVEFKRVPA